MTCRLRQVQCSSLIPCLCAPLPCASLMPRLHTETHGLQDIRTADWSNEVAPFWGEVIKSSMTGEGIMGLLKAGWTTIKGAVAASKVKSVRKWCVSRCMCGLNMPVR